VLDCVLALAKICFKGAPNKIFKKELFFARARPPLPLTKVAKCFPVNRGRKIFFATFTPLEGPVRKGGDEGFLNEWFGRGLKPLPNLLTGFTFGQIFNRHAQNLPMKESIFKKQNYA